MKIFFVRGMGKGFSSWRKQEGRKVRVGATKKKRIREGKLSCPDVWAAIGSLRVGKKTPLSGGKGEGGHAKMSIKQGEGLISTKTLDRAGDFIGDHR